MNTRRIIVVACLAIFSMNQVALNARTPYPEGGVRTLAQQESMTADSEKLYRDSKSLALEARYVLARARLFQAVDLWLANNQQDRAREVLFEAASYYGMIGQWQIALECDMRLLGIENLSEQRKVELFSAIGRLYANLHNFDVALDYYRRAVELAHRLNYHAAEALAYAGYASVYLKLGEIKLSKDYLARARSILGRDQDDDVKASVLALVGQIDYAERRIPEAITSFERALSLYKQNSRNPGETSSLMSSLSGLYLISGRKDAALNLATEALSIANQLKAQEQVWRALLAKGRALRALGQHHEAFKAYYGAFGAIEMQALNIWADSLKIGFLEEAQTLYREFTALLVEAGRTDEAFNIVEYARARAMLGLLSESRDVAARLQRGDVNPASRIVNRLIARPGELDHDKPLTDGALQAGESPLQHEDMRLASELGRVNKFTQPATLTQTQARLLGQGETLIEYFLADEHSYAWLVTHDSFQCITLPGQKDIEAVVRQYLDAITSKPNSLYLERERDRQKTLAAKLFDLLFGAFGGKLTVGRRLLIAPAGLLYYLPFETLVRGGRYLIEDHALSYVPSASVLCLLREPRPTSQISTQMELLAFGEPCLGPARPPSVMKKKGNAGGVRPDGRVADLALLPNSRNEVLAISKLFPQDRQRVYVGQAMTESAMKRESLQFYKHLHMATHCLIDERFPARSAVVFSPEAGNVEDGLLEVGEIIRLKLDCELVVLSACRTGQGRLVNGEGLVGFARAFLYAGAQAVLVSAWSVSDISTAALMENFYRHLAEKLSPPAALRQAKLELLASGKAMRHPYYWGAFLLISE
jgi:CHAT domain-containing protein